jgi:probable DNA repair protein
MALNLPQISLEKTTQIIAAQDLVLTRNNRQSRFLEKAWAHTSGHQALPNRPAILPIQAWLKQQYLNVSSTKIIPLADALCLLSDLIQAEESSSPMEAQTLAKYTLQANALLTQWQLPLVSLESHTDNPTTTQCLAHIQKLRTYLKKHQQITAEAITEEITSRLNSLEKNTAIIKQLPTAIYLYGFVDINPSLANLFEALNQHCPVYKIQPQHFPTLQQAHTYKNRNHELNAMAQWALDFYSANPGKTVTCVVPNLSQAHTACLGAFIKADSQSLELINISSGEPLSQTLIGQTALSFLNLKSYQTPLKTLAECIRIPCWLENNVPYQTEKDRLANQLYEAGFLTQPLKRWLANLHTDNETNEALINHLENWSNTKLKQPKGKQSFKTWLEYFCEQWQAIGWPGKQALSSLHYQQYQHFQKVWLSFLNLDSLLSPCTHEHALDYFNLLCRQSLFAPESKNRPIHILGALEAHGLQSDALWMCHVDSHTWPPSSKPNPLLPFSFQRLHTMPNACHLFTKHYYETITKDIIASAPEVFISYAQWHDHLEQTASPFFQTLRFEQQHEILPDTKDNKSTWFQETEDLKGPSLSGNKIPGGSYGLQSQAQCPFQYFSRYRLNLSECNEPSIGLEAFERGTLVHEALAYFYQHIPNSQKLATIEKTQRDQMIENAIVYSLKNIYKNKLFIDTEKARLTLLLNQWVDFELTRPQFTIENIESTIHFSIHNFNLNLRVDRIDRLDDDYLLVMDYKTSQQASTQGWYDDRLTNPQIPLYVLSIGEQCQNVALALVKRGEPKFVGVSTNQTGVKGIRSTHKDDKAWQWPALKTSWQEKISNLTFEIKTGYAAVMPDKKSNPCQYCEMALMCRVHHD